MKALIVYTHPNPRSFNHAILETVEADLKGRGVEVRVSDLYAKRFDPALSPRDFESFAAGRLPQDICDEQNDVTWADLLVFIYPIWWYERPALLKGWFDRVFSIGFAYKPSDKGIVGLLKGKRGLVFSTAGAFEEESVQSGMIHAMEITVVEGSLKSVGIDPVVFRNYYAIPSTTEEERKGLLVDVRRQLEAVLSSQAEAPGPSVH